MAASNSRVYNDGAPPVTIPGHGSVRGASIVNVTTGQSKSYRYTGLPYALPPTGQRRFQKPHPLPSDFRYDATPGVYSAFGPVCPQPSHFDFVAGLPSAAEPRPRLPTPTHQYSEDCLRLNIWVPARPPPPAGYPVFFFLHGGWLQVGNAHHDVLKDPSDLLATHAEGGKDLCAIVVAPGYRLNVFGFLALRGAAAGQGGNFGFWDQRMALEWVVRHIAAFKGDPNNITLGGLSAGAHSAHSQALYEFVRTRNTDERPLFRRLFLQSNAAMVPAKTLAEAAEQTEELCRALGIDATDDEARRAALCDVDADKLVATLPQLRMHTFRAVRGAGQFVDPSWAHAMLDGDFARWCKRHGVQFMLGECAHEEHVYGLVNPPRGDKNELQRQLNTYYPQTAAKRLMKEYALPSSDDADDQAWVTVFGMIAADSQVYAAQRTLVTLLTEHGLGATDVFRWQVCFRARFLDRYTPAWMGVSHSFDDALWWFSRALLLEPFESDEFEGALLLDTIRAWLLPFVMFLNGRDTTAKLWYGGAKMLDDERAGKGRLLRRFASDGTISVVEDDRWDAKANVVACIRTLLEEAAADSAPKETSTDKDAVDTELTRQLDQTELSDAA